MKEILIRREHLEGILAHAREGYPNEVCGLLGGRGNSVERLYCLRNADASPASYSLDPREQFRAMGEMAREGLELLGIYHSHPDALAVPSLVDIHRAFFPGTREPNYPGVVYLIVGPVVEGPEARAFLIGGDSVERVEIVAS